MKKCMLASLLIFNLITSSSQSNANHCLLESRSEPAPVFEDAYFSPFVVNPTETFSMMIKLNQSGYKSIEVKAPNWSTLLYKKAIPVTLLLNDDGMEGDEKAGDRIFTINQLSTSVSPSIFYPTSLFYRNADLTFTTISGTKEVQNIDLAFGIRFIPSTYTNPAVKSINATVQMTDYVINMVLPANMINDRFAMAKEYYKYLPDDRDYIVRSTTYPTPGTFPAANFYSVKNQTLGFTPTTSATIYDRTADYNSKGKLAGFINMFYTHGGEPIILNHELLHTWAAYTHPDLKLDNSSHWSYAVLGTSGFGSGIQASSITKLADGNYSVTPTSLNFYNSLELYLMGLHPADSIQFPIMTPVEPEFVKFDLPNTIIKASNLKSINKSEFFSLMPERNPAFPNTQREFKVGSMVISDRLLTPKELSYFHEIMKEVENKNQTPQMITAGNLSFYTATNKKGMISTRLATLTPTDDHRSRLKFNIYPNPSTRVLFIDALMDREYTYCINDLRGQLMTHGTIKNNTLEISLPSGLYLFTLSDKNGLAGIQKLMVQAD